jgi:hypothetical protein
MLAQTLRDTAGSKALQAAIVSAEVCRIFLVSKPMCVIVLTHGFAQAFLKKQAWLKRAFFLLCRVYMPQTRGEFKVCLPVFLFCF